jgi:hypothetical protein
MLGAALHSFAWAGPATIGADVLLGEPDGDALVEALAALLWERRHSWTA